MSINVYINFKGNCREAVAFYSEVFETEKPKLMLFGDMPPNPDYPMDEATKALVMHTNLMICENLVMFSDTPDNMPFIQGNNITLTLNVKDLDKLKAYFQRMKEGGTIVMDLQETFWSKCYGFVIDKYGIGWQFSYEE